MLNLLLLIPGGIVLLALWRVGFSKTGSFWDGMTEEKQMKSIRGVAVLLIMLHHLTQVMGGFSYSMANPLYWILTKGFFLTSIYFFYSGYGLMVSYRTKDHYLDGFFKKKIVGIWIPFVLSNLIYILVRILFEGKGMHAREIGRYLFGLRLINPNSWYVIEILILYLVFGILYRVIRNDHIANGLFVAFTILFIILMMRNGRDSSGNQRWFMGEWWFNSTGIFLLGMLFGLYGKKLGKILQKGYRWIVLPVTVLFILACVLEEKVRSRYGYSGGALAISGVNGKLLTFTVQTVAAAMFILFLMVLHMKVKTGNRILEFFGTISFELYLIHGVFVKEIILFSKAPILVRYLVSMICSILLAVILCYVDRTIQKKIRKLSEKRSVRLEEKKKLKQTEPFDPEKYIYEKEKKKRIYKRIAICTVGITLLVGFSIPLVKSWKLSCEFKEEYAALQDANEGDIILFGRFDTAVETSGKERLRWIVLKREGNRVMLVTERGIDGAFYHRNYTPITWEQSDLRRYINSADYLSIFSDREQALLQKDPETQDLVSLLTVEQVLSLFPDEESRQLGLTSYAESIGTNANVNSKVNQWDMKGYRSSWWWLRGEEKSILAPIVTVDGEILTDKRYVNKPNGAIRPVIWLEIEEP